MRRVLVLAVLGVAGACGSFGSSGGDAKDPVDDAGPVAADAGDAAVGLLSDGTTTPPGDVEAGACTPHPKRCNGNTTLLDFRRTAPKTSGTRNDPFVLDKTEPCGALHAECAAGATSNVFAYYIFPLTVTSRHFFVHQRIRGPVAQAVKTSTPDIAALTFGCGYFLTTDEGEALDARLEVAETHFEIDGENTGGSNPSGTDIFDLVPDKTTELDWTLEITLVDTPPRELSATAHINGTPYKAPSLSFVGVPATAELRCGLLQADETQAQTDVCDLTIRQMELEICP